MACYHALLNIYITELIGGSYAWFVKHTETIVTVTRTWYLFQPLASYILVFYPIPGKGLRVHMPQSLMGLQESAEALSHGMLTVGCVEDQNFVFQRYFLAPILVHTPAEFYWKLWTHSAQTCGTRPDPWQQTLGTRPFSLWVRWI